jgi:hypothetical protein
VRLSAWTPYRHAHHLLTPPISTEILARPLRLPCARLRLVNEPQSIFRHTLSGITLQDSSTRRYTLSEILRRLTVRSRGRFPHTAEAKACETRNDDPPPTKASHGSSP